ncbi:MAG: nucleotidyltransferase [Chloroflexi bacterium]|nr:nucleotidyltransferase [Chloroflexota bacterium]
MSETLKIVIPMAGWGTRMRPHTWSKPKPLVGVAGKTAFDYLLDMFQTLPNPKKTEFVFIVGPYLGETQIPPFIAEHYPDIKAHYVVQGEMKGQSHALYLGRQYLSGPMIMCFSDTLIETDFSFLDREKSDCVAWVKAVADPRRFGVAEVNKDGWVTHLIEKPQTMENNLALVGCYYFKSSENLMSAIEEQMQRNVQLKNEFFLADAVNILIEHGALTRVQKVETWLDTGTIEATLETNRYLLESLKAGKLTGSQHSNIRTSQQAGVKINEPVFIHETAEVKNSTIGPYASIGADCKITGSRIEDSILEAGCEIKDSALKGSLIGRQAKVEGRGAGETFTLNIGDNSHVILS